MFIGGSMLCLCSEVGMIAMMVMVTVMVRFNVKVR